MKIAIAEIEVALKRIRKHVCDNEEKLKLSYMTYKTVLDTMEQLTKFLRNFL
jgi:hypothetical protein